LGGGKAHVNVSLAFLGEKKFKKGKRLKLLSKEYPKRLHLYVGDAVLVCS